MTSAGKLARREHLTVQVRRALRLLGNNDPTDEQIRVALGALEYALVHLDPPDAVAAQRDQVWTLAATLSGIMEAYAGSAEAMVQWLAGEGERPRLTSVVLEVVAKNDERSGGVAS
jgi:hypothetical protein